MNTLAQTSQRSQTVVVGNFGKAYECAQLHGLPFVGEITPPTASSQMMSALADMEGMFGDWFAEFDALGDYAPVQALESLMEKAPHAHLRWMVYGILQVRRQMPPTSAQMMMQAGAAGA